MDFKTLPALQHEIFTPTAQGCYYLTISFYPHVGDAIHIHSEALSNYLSGFCSFGGVFLVGLG